MRNLKAPQTTQKIGSLLVLSILMSTLTMQVNPAGFWQPGGQTQLVAEAGWGFWQRRRPRTRLTTRSNLCAITPGFIGKLTLWHDRPLFTWKGESAVIQVRDYQTQEVIWSQSIDSKAQQVTYRGNTALAAGKLYEWQVLGPNPADSDQKLWTTFKTMPTEERQAIERDLTALAKSGNQEAIVLEKADYFAAKNLWSDAIQVLYSIDQVSDSFAETRSNYIQDFCGQSPAKTAAH